MEDYDTREVGYPFLMETASKHLFSRLDFALKDGVHFQRHGSDPDLFAYLKRYEHQLKPYYQNLFGVRLETKGEGEDQYYFLDYHSVEMSAIPDAHKRQMKNEHVIIGFIIYKIVFFDGNLELNSIALDHDLI